MTTETSAPSGTPHRATGPVVGLRSLVGSALVCLVVALVLALIAAYAGGGWWWASLAGSLIAIAVFLLGASLVALVAAVLPLQVLDPVLPALDEIGASGLAGTLDHLRIG